MLQLSTEDMIWLVNKWVSDLARENHIIPVFKGFHNGQYGSYTKNPGFYKSIRFQKDDLDVYIDYDDEAVFNEEIYNLSPAHFEIINAKQHKYQEMLMKVIEDGIKCGEFRPEISPKIITLIIFGMINWIYRWYKHTGKYSLIEIAQIYNDFILQSILVDESKSEYKDLLLPRKK